MDMILFLSLLGIAVGLDCVGGECFACGGEAECDVCTTVREQYQVVIDGSAYAGTYVLDFLNFEPDLCQYQYSYSPPKCDIDSRILLSFRSIAGTAGADVSFDDALGNAVWQDASIGSSPIDCDSLVLPALGSNVCSITGTTATVTGIS